MMLVEQKMPVPNRMKVVMMFSNLMGLKSDLLQVVLVFWLVITLR